MAGNPNPRNITAEMWRFWEEFRAFEPGVRLGGILADKPGYHNTRARNRAKWPGNYSIREREDQGGPDDKAAAIDLTFPDAQRGDYRTIARYMKRILASGRDPEDPRLDGWREWYGQADSDAHVEGWDSRHLVEITSDPSHLWHMHGSIDRDKVDHWPTYDACLSVLKGESLPAWKLRTGQVMPPATKPAPVPEKAPSSSTSHRPGTRVVVQGMTGDDVRFLQRWIGPEWMGPADGIAGPKFTAGLRRYQKMRGIKVDGKAGPQVFRQMGITWRG